MAVKIETYDQKYVYAAYLVCALAALGLWKLAELISLIL